MRQKKICKEKGFQKVGLGVSIENELARKLYERLGYEDSGLGEFDISFMWRSRPEEPEHEINERVVYLIKKI
jgi:RimJ/RimL family protein N-acetyltransferase